MKVSAGIYRTSLVDESVEPMDDLRAGKMVGVTAVHSVASLVDETVAHLVVQWVASTDEQRVYSLVDEMAVRKDACSAARWVDCWACVMDVVMAAC